MIIGDGNQNQCKPEVCMFSANICNRNNSNTSSQVSWFCEYWLMFEGIGGSGERILKDM